MGLYLGFFFFLGDGQYGEHGCLLKVFRLLDDCRKERVGFGVISFLLP